MLKRIWPAARASFHWLAALGPAFWFFQLGLTLIFIGAYRIHPPAAFLLSGLLIVWDSTRTPPAPPARPAR